MTDDAGERLEPFFAYRISYDVRVKQKTARPDISDRAVISILE